MHKELALKAGCKQFDQTELMCSSQLRSIVHITYNYCLFEIAEAKLEERAERSDGSQIKPRSCHYETGRHVMKYSKYKEIDVRHM